MEQDVFIKQMSELADLGRAKEGKLTVAEVADYCADMSLTEEQIEMVISYLTEVGIQIEDYDKPQDDAIPDKRGQTDKQDTKFVRRYNKELSSIQPYDKEAIQALYARLRDGEGEILHDVVEAHMGRVFTLAKKYRGRGVLLEDLVQEGNLELVSCVAALLGNREVLDYKKAIDHAVRSRLIEMVDEELTDSDSITTILARVNLLHEATKALAEEYGRIATIEELSDFTHMSVEEIRMYVDLSKDKIEIGKGEPA